jgi:hypothetical protein
LPANAVVPDNGFMNKKHNKFADRITLSSSTCVGMRQRIRHRLDKRDDMLTPQERDFILSMYDRLAFSNNITKKQENWLNAILARTDTKEIKRRAMVAEKIKKLAIEHETDRF